MKHDLTASRQRGEASGGGISVKCCECGDIIIPGHLYEHIGSVYEGVAYSYKTCDFCAKEYQAMLDRHPYLTWLKGELACLVVWELRANEGRQPC